MQSCINLPLVVHLLENMLNKNYPGHMLSRNFYIYCTPVLVCCLVQSNVVQGGETFSWPIWFHCGTPGRISLLISIYYEMENSSSGMTYRTLRMQQILEVSESSWKSDSSFTYPQTLSNFV